MSIELINRGNYEESKEPVANLESLIEFLLNLRLPSDSSTNEFWSFRGQRDSNWMLGIEPHDPNIRENKKADYSKCFLQYKKRMLNERKLDYLNVKNPWWWLFYAKHHNLHTKLLDWTSNPLVAIYFAVENILSEKTGNKNNTGGSVWALKVSKENFRSAEDLWPEYGKTKKQLDPSSGKLYPLSSINCRYPFYEKLDPSKGENMDDADWFMINPEPVTSRIVYQSGKFSYHPGEKQIPIDQLERRKGECLIKINIQKEKNDEIRKKLGIMNIHHASLFPSPTGIANFVNYEWPDIAKY
jgi:hypothetical protein